MGFEDSLEKGTSSAKPIQGNKMTLQKAVEMGEYNPEFLSTFAEWHIISRHIQFQYIRTALENRRHQLLQQYAEINNILDFSKKPHLKDAMKNIEKQLRVIEDDRERLFVEYSK
jgi:hypothetical protein